MILEPLIPPISQPPNAQPHQEPSPHNAVSLSALLEFRKQRIALEYAELQHVCDMTVLETDRVRPENRLKNEKGCSWKATRQTPVDVCVVAVEFIKIRTAMEKLSGYFAG